SISDTGVITVTNDNSLSSRYEQYLDGIAYQVPTGTVYQDYGKLKDEVRLIIMDTSLLSDSQKRMLTQVNVKYVDINSIMPQTAYGTTMQSADNILGTPYFVGLLYEGKLSTYSTSLSEYDYTAYFIENLYHVNNEDVETVLDAMVGDGCGSGYTGLKRSYNYNDLINSMIEIGADYYHSKYPNNDGDWAAANDGRI
ncbi:MAG: hypothetical protein LUD72_06800, partial [Bacteroidales bacterium]|nr:hypothetical protein [Bacteroidales bacterium]